MRKKQCVRILVMGLLVPLLLILFTPVVTGDLGTGVDDAPLYKPGTTVETFPAGWGDGYFNVTGRVGWTLTITISFDYPSYELDLFLAAPNGTSIDSDETDSGVKSVSTICESNLNYTISLFRMDGGTDEFSYTLSITLKGSSSGIPAFNLYLASFSICILLGMAIVFNRLKRT